MSVARIVAKLVTLVVRAGMSVQGQWLRLQGVQIDPGARVYLGAVVQRQNGTVKIGAHSTVHSGAKIYAAGGSVVIGQHCSINPGCLIYGHGGLSIGNDVRIAANTVIVPANHNVDAVELLIREQGETRRGIVIGNDVWIGAGVIILDGVSVADGSVIGAGSVVTRSTDRNGIYVGNPARLLRFRGALRREHSDS